MMIPGYLFEGSWVWACLNKLAVMLFLAGSSRHPSMGLNVPSRGGEPSDVLGTAELPFAL
jgi:hypothetical protein